MPFVMFLVYFEFRFLQLNPSHYAAKKQLFEHQAADVELLVLGPSHAFTGIAPLMLGRPAFNLAGNSQSLFYDVALLRKYLPSLPSLKVVVLPITYWSLEAELDQGSERWRCYYYSYFFTLPHRDWHMASSARNFSAWFLCGSEISRSSVLFGTCANALTHYDPSGGWTNRPAGTEVPVGSDDLARSARATLKRHEGSMRQENLAVNVARLDEIIGELQGKRVQVILVTIPVTKYYVAGVNPERFGRMHQAILNLTAKYGLEYRSYMSDSRFTDTDFADGDHLNWRGAQKFSRMLAQELIEPSSGSLNFNSSKTFRQALTQ